MKAYMTILGCPVEDLVTGFKGVVTSITFDLYGCVQCVVNPPSDKDGKYGDALLFDHKRLFATGGPVMQRPDFGEDYPPGTEAGPAAIPGVRRA